MLVHQTSLTLPTQRAGLHEFTQAVATEVNRSGITTGLVSIFVRHTSCSLVIMENADPSARQDLERWMNRLVPANDPDFEHTTEGPDDMPSHIKMALTRTSETLPITHGRLQLGTWQGLFLWEHRQAPHQREILLTVIGT